jgi:hypothetical protein
MPDELLGKPLTLPSAFFADRRQKMASIAELN